MSSRGKRNRRGETLHHHSQNKPESNAAVANIDESLPIVKTFRQYQGELDSRHDKYERLVKISRDITIESKRTIFLLHRVSGADDETRNSILQDSHKKIIDIQQNKFQLIAKELHGEDPYQFTRAYSAGTQEYIEAVSFYHYLKTDQLVSADQIAQELVFPKAQMEQVKSENSLEVNTVDAKPITNCEKMENMTITSSTEKYSVFLSPMDYMLGIADLTGEIMRMAIHSIGSGDMELPFKLCKFMRTIHDAFLSFGNISKELPRKLSVLRQSLSKVENACYTLQVRGSEMPKHMLADVIISDRQGNQPVYMDDHRDMDQD